MNSIDIADLDCIYLSYDEPEKEDDQFYKELDSSPVNEENYKK